MKKVYKVIGQLAVELQARNMRMTFSKLNERLGKLGMAHGSNRGLASAVAAAYRHWEREDPNSNVHDAIASVFLDRNGDYAYENY